MKASTWKQFRKLNRRLKKLRKGQRKELAILTAIVDGDRDAMLAKIGGIKQGLKSSDQALETAVTAATPAK